MTRPSPEPTVMIGNDHHSKVYYSMLKAVESSVNASGELAHQANLFLDETTETEDQALVMVMDYLNKAKTLLREMIVEDEKCE